MRHAGRLDRRLSVTCALAVFAGLLLALPAVGSATSTQSPRQLLRATLADAEASGSFHQTFSATVGGEHVTYVQDSARRAGRQLVTISDGTHAEVVVVANSAYVTGNQRGLTKFLGFPSAFAHAVGKRWVGIPSSNPDYATVANAVTLKSALAQLTPVGQLKMLNTTFRGRAVIAISGQARTATAESGRLTLYVTNSTRPLPVYATLTATDAGRAESGVATLSDWGEPVNATPPTYSVPIDAQSGAISDAPGYSTFAGPHGYPLPVGRPWGKACKPIRLAASSDVPKWAYAQIATVVQQARRAGIDVTLESRQLTWNPKSLYFLDGQSAGTSALVPIFASDATPPKLSAGKPQHIALGWDAKLDPDGHNEDLTHAQGQLWLRVLAGHPELVRRSIRQLIAMTQGIATPTEGVSGFSDAPTTDRLTSADIAAMLRMSGCATHPAAT